MDIVKFGAVYRNLKTSLELCRSSFADEMPTSYEDGFRNIGFNFDYYFKLIRENPELLIGTEEKFLDYVKDCAGEVKISYHAQEQLADCWRDIITILEDEFLDKEKWNNKFHDYLCDALAEISKLNLYLLQKEKTGAFIVFYDKAANYILENDLNLLDELIGNLSKHYNSEGDLWYVAEIGNMENIRSLKNGMSSDNE